MGGLDILFVSQGVECTAHSSQNRIKWLKRHENIFNAIGIIIPEGFVLFAAFCVISEGSMGQQNKQIDGVEVASDLSAAGQTVCDGHYQISSVIHMSSPAPESRNKQFPTNSLWLLSPDVLIRVGFELIFLRIAGPEDIIPKEIDQKYWDSMPR